MRTPSGVVAASRLKAGRASHDEDNVNGSVSNLPVATSQTCGDKPLDKSFVPSALKLIS
jgi:hypothetical protein